MGLTFAHTQANTSNLALKLTRHSHIPCLSPTVSASAITLFLDLGARTHVTGECVAELLSALCVACLQGRAQQGAGSVGEEDERFVDNALRMGLPGLQGTDRVHSHTSVSCSGT